MVRAKWAAIFPLRITGAITFADGDPAMSAHRLSLARIRLFEPGNHQRRFRLELAVRDIVVRQRKIEGILFWNKRHGPIIASRASIRIIGSAVIRRPIKIPRAFIIGDRIIAPGLFSNPKDGRHDIRFPRVTLDRRARTGRDKNLRFNFEQRLLPQFHRILGEICRRRIWGSGLLIPEKFWDDKDRQTQTDRKKSPHYKRRHLLSDFGRSGKPNFPVSRMRNAAWVVHLRREVLVLIWLNRD
jgi:hypothetical protein